MSFGTLTIRMPDGRTATVTVDRAQLRIGRNPDNDVVIDDASVSGYHARLFASQAGLSLLDLGSRNGTEVDGKPIGALTTLTPASRVRIGTATLTITPPGSQAPSGDFVLPVFPEPPAPKPIAAAAGATTARAEGPPVVRLELQPPRAKADISAGGPAILVFTATLQNLSRYVDRFELVLEGPPWLGVTIDPPAHNLKPRDEAVSRVELSVPRTSAASAGKHEIALVARSQKRPELRFAATSTLEVTPFTEFRFDLLEPRHRTAWTGGTFRAQVQNNANRSVVYNFEGLSSEGALNFRFDPDPVELKAGERQETELKARFKLLRLFGRPQTYDFQATCEPVDQSALLQQAQGRLIQRPPMAPWLLISSAVLSILALLTACIIGGYNALARSDLDDKLIAQLFPSPVPTAGPSPTVPVDLTATLGAVAQDQEATLEAIAAAGTAQASAVAGENAATQTAQAGAFAATQAVAQTAAATAQTAAAGSAGGTATAQASAAAGIGTAAALTATAQSNGTSTAIAATLTTIARTTTVTPPTALPTPTATPTTGTPVVGPPPAGAGQTITFDKVRGLSINQRIPIRGDEYAAQDAFFCFYSPSFNGGGGLGHGSTRALYALAQQIAPLTIAMPTVTLSEGSSGGTTNFVFTITATSATTATVERVFVLEYRTSDGGVAGVGVATSPSDYLPLSGNFALRIPAGETSAQATVTVAVSADLEAEQDEGFTLTLTSPEGVPLFGQPQASGIILNDDQPSPTPTNTATATANPAPVPVPAGDLFSCQPPVPDGTTLQQLQPVILPPPVTSANNAPLHSLTTDNGEGALIPNAIAVVNFQRNVSEVNVNVWYPGGEAAAYLLFAFDERGTLVATARRDAIGVPAAYQLNIRSLERPVRQVVIEARREYSGTYDGTYRYNPVVPPVLTQVNFTYTNP